ncbi:MAG: hypothetical protein PHU06_14280 [Gallionella sp.]|nr:hypothetical protein [Gallionella sp.]
MNKLSKQEIINSLGLTSLYFCLFLIFYDGHAPYYVSIRYVSIGQVIFLFTISAIGPFLAMFSIWYVPVGMLLFIAFFYFVCSTLKYLRVFVFSLLFFVWLLLGIICFALAIGEVV